MRIHTFYIIHAYNKENGCSFTTVAQRRATSTAEDAEQQPICFNGAISFVIYIYISEVPF